ncbi:MAG: porin [Pseudomonadota bacterium]
MLRISLLLPLGFALYLATADSEAQSEDNRGYALGVGISADNADGFTAIALADLSLSEAASVSASVGATRAAARPEDLRTREWSIGGRYDFGAVGIEARGGQSGDPDDFDAEDLMVGLFHQGEHWRVSLQYLERDIDLVLRTSRTQQSFEFNVPLQADGWRLSTSYRTESRWRWYGQYRQFDYDRDLSPLSNRFIVERLTPTTLTLATSLLDDSLSVGMEVPLGGSKALNVAFARDTLAGNLGSVDSASFGMLMPVGQRGDLDITIGISQGDDNFGDDSTFYLNVLYLFYGLF